MLLTENLIGRYPRGYLPFLFLTLFYFPLNSLTWVCKVSVILLSESRITRRTRKTRKVLWHISRLLHRRGTGFNVIPRPVGAISLSHHRRQFKERRIRQYPQAGRCDILIAPELTWKPSMEPVYLNLMRQATSLRIQCDKDIAPTGLGVLSLSHFFKLTPMVLCFYHSDFRYYLITEILPIRFSLSDSNT